mmetsp:Transcript_60832/g.199177  ORF Transcript_60832/g.199177 Transcript_60832/m.199177 type:complete len:176 (+) Transcript_60832:132-659(+)
MPSLIRTCALLLLGLAPVEGIAFAVVERAAQHAAVARPTAEGESSQSWGAPAPAAAILGPPDTPVGLKSSDSSGSLDFEEATKPKANTARGTPPLQNRAPKNQVVGGEYDRAFMTEVWLSNHDGKPNSLDYLIDGNGVRVRELIRFPAHRSAASLGMSLLGPWAAALLLVVGAQA